jgi:VWFA-related protein
MSPQRAAGILIVVAAAASAGTLAARSRQTFRAATDAVSIDVSVRDGSRAITRLQSQDFELIDNGVRQSIEAISIEQVPVDLTLLLDASSSTAQVIERFKERAQQLAAMLRRDDRVRLVAFSGEVIEVFPLTQAGGRLPLEKLVARGTTSLHEALLLSLARSQSAGHRQLVVMFSDGLDTGSVIDAATVATIATRADCVLHIVLSGYPGAKPPTARSLRAAAEATGGALHEPGAFDNAVDAFRRVFEDFRQSYVLRYTLTGVEHQGWHEVTVRVMTPDGGRYTVRGRRRYFGG